MSLVYRYPGAKPFSPEESDIFFGREKEIGLLYQRVRREPLLVLYSKSGLGKSSLLSAGLVPKIEKGQKYLPFNIRFGALQSELGKMPLDTAQEILEAGSPLLDRLHKEEATSLWYLLKARQLAQPSVKGALLIFDQFEELFTYPSEAIEAFARQLSEVLYTTIPDRFRQGMEQVLQVGDEAITEEELRILHRPFQTRVILAIRSDRLAGCPDCPCMLEEAEKMVKTENYDLAIRLYNAYKACDPAGGEVAEMGILEVFNLIREQRGKACRPTSSIHTSYSTPSLAKSMSNVSSRFCLSPFNRRSKKVSEYSGL